MSLSDIKIKAARAFMNIGKANGTAPPHSEENRFSIAYEYYISRTLKSLAEKREEQAKEAARKAGILGEDYKPDSTATVYTSDELQIIAKTANPAKRLDAAALRTALIKKMPEKEADLIIAAATKENKAATSFIFVED